jgi:hypothetical protein
VADVLARRVRFFLEDSHGVQARRLHRDAHRSLLGPENRTQSPAIPSFAVSGASLSVIATSLGLPASAVPEPAGGMILLIAGLLPLRRRRNTPAHPLH